MDKLQPPPPPGHLSERSKALWQKLIHRCRTAGRPELLENALRALDVADASRAVLDAAGLTVKTLGSGAVRAHPLVTVESAARREFRDSLRRLQLDYEPDPIFSEGRTP